MECALAFGVIAAIVCGLVANMKGRNVVGWAIFGFFFGLIAIIVVLIISDLKEEAARFERVNDDNRRLREQLQQHAFRTDEQHEQVSRRLDVYDQRLGVDSRALAAGQQAVGQLPLRDVLDNPSVADTVNKPAADKEVAEMLAAMAQVDTTDWYYQREGKQVGPLATAVLEDLIKMGAIKRDTLVWAKHLPQWQDAGLVQQLSPLFEKPA